MKRLGISVYLENAPLADSLNYITLAHSYGFSRIFTCLISAEPTGEFFGQFKTFLAHAKALNMEVIADVSPEVLKSLNIHWKDLRPFKELGLSGIRLDMGFSGMEESFMSFDPAQLLIELNASNGNRYLENILSYCPNQENIIGCHNFYPHPYTGLSRAHFLKTSEQFKSLGIRTAAFVSSQAATFGPWPISEGLPTLEEHRHLPIDVQAKDLFNTGLIDDVIIGNSFASEAELKALSEVNPYKLELSVELLADLPEIEKKIIFQEPHFNRGDVSDYLIRSTQSRVKYKDYSFKLTNPQSIIKAGDIIIESETYKRYSGELQLALKEMTNSGKSSVVARVVPEELFLLDKIKPWQKFGFIAQRK